MENIQISRIKELRERTGAGLMDCKISLLKANGDMDVAIQVLREKGLSAAAKKHGRITSEGLVYSYIHNEHVAVLLEVNCETDFVAKTAAFKSFVSDVAKCIAIKNPADLTELNALSSINQQTVAETIQSLIHSLGENLTIRRFCRYETSGIRRIYSYVHEDYLTEGKLGVLLEIDVNNPTTLHNENYQHLIRDLLLQVAATKPEYLQQQDIPFELLERESSIIRFQTEQEGKSGRIAETVVEGRMKRFISDICLLEQAYIKDSTRTIATLLKEASEQLNDAISILRFVRFEKGEGL